MISLAPMTRELFHKLNRGFQFDPALFTDMELYERCKARPYDAEQTNRRFDDRMSRPNTLTLAIMRGGSVIGEAVLKRIDLESRQCEIGIHLMNDSVKGLGFGTEALKLAVRHAFDALGMEKVLADCIVKNTRSRHVLEKLGFRFLGEEDGFYKFELDKS